MDSETRLRRLVRRGAPIAAAAALGAGAGVGVYAATNDSGGGPSASATTTVTSQPVATKTTTTTLAQLYKDVTPGVVDITVTGVSSPSQSPFGPQDNQQTQAEGSGFVLDTAGHIVTNAHVVDGATSITVRFQDGSTAKATLVGADDSTDTAVIKVDVAASKLHPLTLGDSSTVQPGQTVVAIGSPFGLAETMTAGIVSAVDRTIQAPNNYSIAGAIQTDAPINHGNSGGPLLNTNGEVIGVNAQIESDSGGNDGVGFALPINSVKSVAQTLIAGGKVQHAYLGIRVGDASGGGAAISSVVSGSPADSAGLKAGDVVTAIDGKAIANADDLTAAVSSHQPQDKVTVTITRNGTSKDIQVTLGTRPS